MLGPDRSGLEHPAHVRAPLRTREGPQPGRSPGLQPRSPGGCRLESLSDFVINLSRSLGGFYLYG